MHNNTRLAASLAIVAGLAFSVFASNDYTGATGGDWFDDTNWSLGHVPTAADDVVISSTTVNATNAIVAASVTLSSARLNLGSTAARSNLVASATISGDLTLTGTSKLYVTAGELPEANWSVFADNATAIAALRSAANVISVGGAFAVGDTSVVYPTAAVLTGVPVIFRVGTFSLAEGASINVTKRGWGWSGGAWANHPANAKPRKTEGNSILANGWTFAIGSGLSYGIGGSYGGKGRGAPTTWQSCKYGYTYGSPYAPFLPGAPAGYYQSVERGLGPGSAVVLATGAATVNGAVVADGTQHVSGVSYDYSGTSGGGIWLAASSFAFGPGARLSARGGGPTKSNMYGSGGGGRIAIAQGCTAAQIDALFAGSLPEGTLALELGKMIVSYDVAGGKIPNGASAEDGTAFAVVPASTAASVTVAADTDGLAIEGVELGETVLLNGSYDFTAPQYASLASDPGVRYTCAGYVVSNATSEIASGNGLSASFTVDGADGPYSLTWLWDDRAVKASVAISGAGSVSVGGVSHDADFEVFVASGEATTFTAVPSQGAHFVSWSGDLIANGFTTNAAISIAPSAPFSLTAAFAVGRTTRVWTGGAGTSSWGASANWWPIGLPLAEDDVFATNATIVASSAFSVHSLTLAGTTRLTLKAVPSAGGSDAATLYASATPFSVTDHVEIGDTSTVVFKNDAVTGAAAKLLCESLRLGADASMTADGTGWHWYESAEPALGTSGVYRTWAPGRGHSYTQGAGYGGLGGNSSAPYGRTYGYKYAPFLPGSPNGLHQDKISNGHPGGGTVWIVCSSTLELNGTITAIGERSYYGAASGGGVWLAARGVTIGVGASVSVMGGTLQGGYSSRGGGGRVSLALGLTPAQLDALAAGETPEGLSYEDSISLFSVDVRGGMKEGTTPTYGNPGTATTVRGALADTDIVVCGAPVLATGVSPAYGHHGYAPGSTATLTAPAYGYDPDDPSVRYPCLGYVVSNATTEVESGAGTQVEFIVGSEPLTVTWLWGTPQPRTLIRKPADGVLSVNGETLAGDAVFWTMGALPAVSVVPDAGYAFVCWEGNVPLGQAFDNPLSLSVDASVDIVPVLRLDEAAATRTWSGTGLWTDTTKWSPAGNIPGPEDTVVIASGTCVVSNALAAAALQVTGGMLSVGTKGGVNPFVSVSGDAALSGGTVSLGFGPLMTGHARLAVAGDLVLSNAAKLNVFGGPVADAFSFASGCSFVEVGGALALEDTATLSLYSDYMTGGSVKVVADSVSVGASAKVEANQKGYMWLDIDMPPDTPGIGFSYNIGASHGGVGGGNSASSTYGQRLAPVQPGSPNGCYNYSYGNINRGGGLVRIHATKTFTLDGTVSADANTSSGDYGGGSGGGIWLTARDFAFGEGAVLSACGGRSLARYSSNGGGGRIALSRAPAGSQVAELAATGSATGVTDRRVLDEVAFRAAFGNATMTVDVGSVIMGNDQVNHPGTFVFVDCKKRHTILLVQ